MRIVWDEPKRQANLAKHGLDFASLDLAFFERATIVHTRANRWRATAAFNKVHISVVFTFLGREGVSIVSMRRANRMEVLDDKNT